MPAWNQFAPGNPETLFTNVSLNNAFYEHNAVDTSFNWGSGFPNVVGQYLRVEGSGFTYTIDDNEYHLNDTGVVTQLTIISSDGYPVVQMSGLAMNVPDLKNIILHGSTATLRTYIEGLTWTFNGSAGNDDITGGNQDDKFYGSSGSDTIHGLSGSDLLDGGLGADHLFGNGGNDVYYVDDAGDTVQELTGEGNDKVFASVSFVLGASGGEVELLATTNDGGIDAINLTGSDFGQTIRGNAGDNSIDGRGAADLMYGLGGNDTYMIDVAGDRALEALGGGNDTVKTAVSYTLTAGSEIETFATADDAGLASINMMGNSFGQTLRGNAGVNMINGGGGDDAMVGLGGNDIYYVDSASDKVFEAVGGGSDTVKASVSWAMLNGQEVDLLQANAGATGLTLTGNSFANAFLSGAGNDTMVGLGGNDTYYVNNVGDVVTEAGGGGADTVRASVSYALGAGQEVETLLANAGATGLTLTGNNLNNYLLGNAGGDTLIGGLGKDSFTGAGGNDFFVFNAVAESAVATPDIILDFTNGADKLDVHLIDADSNAGNGDTAFTLDALGNNTFATGHIKQTLVGTTLTLDFNTDADSASEMTIVLQNHGAALGVGDIVA